MTTNATPRPTAAQTRALTHAAKVHPHGLIPWDTHPRTVAVLVRHGWATPESGAYALTDAGRVAIGEPVATPAEDTPVVAAETSQDAPMVCVACGQTLTPWTNAEGVTMLVAGDGWGSICGDAPTGFHAPAEESGDEDGTPAEDEAPAPYRPGRDALIGACVPVVMLLGIVVLALLGFGDHGSRVTLGLDAPDAPAVVAPVAVGTPAVSAPSGPLVSTVTPSGCEEDQPCWSCAEMGNRVCGYGTAGGPVGSTARGVLDVACPVGARAVDLSTGPIVPTTDGGALLATVGCEYAAGAPMIDRGVPAHPFGAISAIPLASAPIHASVYAMSTPRTSTPRADARAAARRAVERPALVAWENLTGDESPAEIDAVCRAVADEARPLLRPAPRPVRVRDIVTGYRGTGTVVSTIGGVLVDWRDGHQTRVAESAVTVVGHDD